MTMLLLEIAKVRRLSSPPYFDRALAENSGQECNSLLRVDLAIFQGHISETPFHDVQRS